MNMIHKLVITENPVIKFAFKLVKTSKTLQCKIITCCEIRNIK